VDENATNWPLDEPPPKLSSSCADTTASATFPGRSRCT